MPSVTVPIPETITSVTRPVVFEVVRDLFKSLSINEQTPIMFNGESVQAIQPGTSMDQVGVAPGAGLAGINNMAYYERMTVEVEEQYPNERLLSTAVYRNENRFVFRDQLLNIYMKPVYTPTEITVNFKYKVVDKTEGERWRDTFRTRAALLRDVFLHTASYHYMIPPAYLTILYRLWEMREATDGYGQTFAEYFAEFRSSAIDTVSNQSGSQANWAVSQTQARIQGLFDFEGVPEKATREGEGEAFVFTFSYKFNYDKPIMMVMEYPLMIHNTAVPPDLRPAQPEVYELENKNLQFPMSADYLRYFETGKSHLSVSPGIAIPHYDTFIPKSILPYSSRIFTVMVSVDINNPTLLFNMQELGELTLVPTIRDFMAGEAPYMGQDYMSIFSLTCYQGVRPLMTGTLHMDNMLNVYSNIPLLLREMHHVRLGLMYNLNIISPEARERLCANGPAAQLLLKALAPKLEKAGLLPQIIPGTNAISKYDLQKAANYININQIYTGRRLSPAVLGNGDIGVFTVETLIIQAHRKANANRQ